MLAEFWTPGLAWAPDGLMVGILSVFSRPRVAVWRPEQSGDPLEVVATLEGDRPPLLAAGTNVLWAATDVGLWRIDAGGLAPLGSRPGAR